MASPPAGEHLLSKEVKKCGYLRKQKHGHRRFFVLRESTERSPARLEYYESEKKWRNKSAAKRLITLDSCLCVNKRADAKHKHLIALYTKYEYFAVAAENEHEQESWFRVLTDLIAEGKAFDSPQSTSSLVGFEETSYGLLNPAAYKEVWQVNLKSRGLGQIKNLTGVYRLCLSNRNISFVKLNSDTAAVSLQLMNIRRCGHSDSFFFIEVGRSAVTGPGEFWMQVEDSVVAQNIHETILEAMKTMKELSEFRPRSKSQSASTTPISVPTRRNLNNLPPSQTGLVRRSRTDSMAATPCRVRTSSEGDGSVTRPVSISVSPSSPNPSGRTCRMLESTPGSSSPISTSPRGGAAVYARRPFSCSASISGSLGDSGFILSDDYSSSPGEPKFLSLTRSGTPDSLSSTPPSRDPSDPGGYMLMESAAGMRYRKRTHSLTTPRQQRAAPPLASASLDDYTMMQLGHNSASPKVSYPEDYGDVTIGSSRSSSGNLGDDGYMPMTPGVAPSAGRGENYVAMSPMCVSAPKQIVNPRTHPQVSASLEDSGYMRMWCGSKSSTDSTDYMNMSPGNPPLLQTPPDHCGQVRPTKPSDDAEQYVMMSPQSVRGAEYYSVVQTSPLNSSAPSPVRHSRAGRLGRPNRLSLDTLRTLPSMNEHPLPGEPRSPGEYINIDFNRSSNDSQASSLASSGGGTGRPSLADYINLELGSCPAGETEPPMGKLGSLPEVAERTGGLGEMSNSPSQVFPQSSESKGSPPSLEEQRIPAGIFLLGPAPSTVGCSAKVIRANPQGRRRHSSETFSSTATVTPVFPSFAHGDAVKRPSSVENISSRSSEGSDEECGSPAPRQSSAHYAGGLGYIALNLLDHRDVEKDLVGFAAPSSCKGGLHGLHSSPYVCFKETATTAKD